jgi:hypothetical protein
MGIIVFTICKAENYEQYSFAARAFNSRNIILTTIWSYSTGVIELSTYNSSAVISDQR